MALDVYLQIDGIKGESADSAHQGWIELTSAQWGVKQPKSATASTGGGHTAERCEHQTLAITKLADLSSPLMMMYSSMGKTIPKAKLEFMRADGNGIPIKYYEVELENVLIASVSQAAHGGNILHDVVGLRFSKIRWKYTQQKIGGGTCGNTAGGWRLGLVHEPLRVGGTMPGLQPKDGRGYFMLPQAPEDAGYYVYGTPTNGGGQFGHPAILSLLYWVEHQWQPTDARKFGIGNISKAEGVEYPKHKSHKDGLQVDVRAMRIDGQQTGIWWNHEGYDRAATAKLIALFKSHPHVKKILFNDPEIHGVMPWDKHDDHFHVALWESLK